ncbi:MAG TPA: gliding motility lipoprotein GldH [Cytophagaceae bacterium]|jgi:gliding motility-associated lipoprotein GldH|nr:gliding motility lipoprotein GldH [Cytophagaceae bacterium]
MYRKLIFFVFSACLFGVGLVSCDSSKVYDTMQDLDSTSWNDKKELVYPITIKDASVPYKIYYTVRYDNNYPFYNLYINRVLEDSTGKFLYKKMQGMDLFKADTGIPLGSGMGSEKDYLILSEDNYKFPYAGKYTVKLKQYMRQENIQGISAVGIRIDKVGAEK